MALCLRATECQLLCRITKDHSFPWNAQFWAEPRNLPISTEFLCFRGILWNSVLAGDVGNKCAILWSGLGGCTICIHDFAMKYVTATRAVTGGILKILSWAYLLDRLSVSCSKLLHVENCCSEPRNLANWPAEFGKICPRKLWSLRIT